MKGWRRIWRRKPFRSACGIVEEMARFDANSHIPEDIAMTQSARSVLTAFESLPPSEQHPVATEILRHFVPTDDLPEAALHESADELFRGYDAEEAPGI